MKREIRTYSLLLAVIMLFSTASVFASNLSLQDRLDQAQNYVKQSRVDGALIALDMAERLSPNSSEVMLARLDILLDANRLDEAQIMVDEYIQRLPDQPALFMKKADMESRLEHFETAYDAVLYARVAMGDDEAFQKIYGIPYHHIIITVADGLVQDHRDEEAIRLYEIAPPSEGEDDQYIKLQMRQRMKQQEFDLHPGISNEDFDRALAADQLVLKPVDVSLTLDYTRIKTEADRYDTLMRPYDESAIIGFPEGGNETIQQTLSGDDIYEEVEFISISPDGKQSLVMNGKRLMVMDLDAGDIRFIVPVEGLDADFVKKVLIKQLTNVEEVGVIWSSDSRYIALSYPYMVFLAMRINYGTLLIDAEKGEIKPIVELPSEVVYWQVSNGEISVPFRAMFDPLSEYLYYESYGGFPNSSICRYNISNGESTKIFDVDSSFQTADPALWLTDEGLLSTFGGMNLTDGFGLILHPLNGEQRLIKADVNTSLGRLMYGENLIALAGEHGVLYKDFGGSELEDRILPRSITLFSLDELSSDIFQTTLFVRLSASADKRVEIVTIAANATPVTEQTLMSELEAEEIAQPVGAALSPSGRYMLLPLQSAGIGEKLCIFDIDKRVCGYIDLSQLSTSEGPFAQYSAFNTPRQCGIRWADHNRILLNANGQNRLYELAIAS